MRPGLKNLRLLLETLFCEFTMRETSMKAAFRGSLVFLLPLKRLSCLQNDDDVLHL